ncbi:MAG: cytochrome c biogenesis protein CcdA [Candidatus Peribacteraceae bacterium]|nr:cytochrome c biogenesis protein CcdA [Candidatus Peribacteraceae bacterium]
MLQLSFRRVLLPLLTASFFLIPVAFIASAQEPVDVVYFYGQGCPHCASMHAVLEEMKQEHPALTVHEYDVYSDNEGRDLFGEMARAYSTEIEGVPTLFLSDEVLVGFSSAYRERIEQEIARCTTEYCPSPFVKLVPEEPVQAQPAPSVPVAAAQAQDSEEPQQDYRQMVTIPAVLAAAAVDAVNPCEFAVLIILITTVLASGKKRRALYAGLAFSLSIFISYYLMGVGLYSAIQFSGLTHTLYQIIAVLAILIGLFNLKDYFWYGKWFLMEVPISWRPRLKALLQSVTSVPGAFCIGFLVSLFLLPCTSGPYIVILGLLAKTATRSHAMALLVLYNLIFILPMVLITFAVYLGMTTVEQAEAWRTKQLRHLHLIAGLILVMLGVGMLLSMQFGWL